eukprot:Rmarinus@m.9614
MLSMDSTSCRFRLRDANAHLQNFISEAKRRTGLRRWFRYLPLIFAFVVFSFVFLVASQLRTPSDYLLTANLKLLPRLTVDPREITVRLGTRWDYQNVIFPLIKLYYPNAKLSKDTDKAPDIVWDIHNNIAEPWDSSSFAPRAAVNAIPGFRTLGMKPNLTSLLQTAEEYYGEHAVDYYPKTFTLPQDEDALRLERVRLPDSVWICKPVDGYSSRGIFLLYPGQPIPSEPLSVQRYVSTPLLYQGKYKFDLRLYLLVTSVDPLVIYHYPLGVPRISSMEYRDDREEAGVVVVKVKGQHPTFRGCMHLTDPHYQLNACRKTAKKLLPTFPATTDDLLERFLDSPYGIRLKPSLREAFEVGVQTVLTLVRLKPQLLRNAHSVISPFRQFKSFQLLGMDVILETDGYHNPNVINAKLIEMNANPNLRVDDRHPFIADLLADVMSISGIAPRGSNYVATMEAQWEIMVSKFCLPNLNEEINLNMRKQDEARDKEAVLQKKISEISARILPEELELQSLLSEQKSVLQELMLLLQDMEKLEHNKLTNQER